MPTVMDKEEYKNLGLTLYYPVGVILASIANRLDLLFLLSVESFSLLLNLNYSDILIYSFIIFILSISFKNFFLNIYSVLILIIPYIIKNINKIPQYYSGFENLRHLLCWILPILTMLCFEIRLKLQLLLLVVITIIIIFININGDFRYFVGTSIILLMVAAYLLSTGLEVEANRIAIVSYYMLVIGVLGLMYEYIKYEPDKNTTHKKE